MNKIGYLPQWYERKELNEKQKEIDACVKALIKTNKLNADEVDEISDIKLALYKDRYSRNYQIRRINELITFVKCR